MVYANYSTHYSLLLTHYSPSPVSFWVGARSELNNIKEAIALYLQPDELNLSPDAVIKEV